MITLAGRLTIEEAKFISDLLKGAKALEIDLEISSAKKLFLYYLELERWNRQINLVSRKQPEWVRAHFLDSLAPLSVGLVGGEERMVDLGAGAGFPGLPLKVARPGMMLAMAEGSGKKCAFLRHIVRTLDLDSAQVLEGRFEDLLEKGWKKQFDIAVSRAAAKPGKIVTASLGFLNDEGRALIYTTPDLTDKSIGKLHPYRVPGSKVQWCVWEVPACEVR
ncbi:16S rRNA (guanine(527)-N(7))-methyltransferase RsmG [bacterium]|nr:MAG: 16S rRNA (guanine(527)-N(7))-methyltransferase RsmG [bacterium]